MSSKMYAWQKVFNKEKDRLEEHVFTMGRWLMIWIWESRPLSTAVISVHARFTHKSSDTNGTNRDLVSQSQVHVSWSLSPPFIAYYRDCPVPLSPVQCPITCGGGCTIASHSFHTMLWVDSRGSDSQAWGGHRRSVRTVDSQTQCRVSQICESRIGPEIENQSGSRDCELVLCWQCESFLAEIVSLFRVRDWVSAPLQILSACLGGGIVRQAWGN